MLEFPAEWSENNVDCFTYFSYYGDGLWTKLWYAITKFPYFFALVFYVIKELKTSKFLGQKKARRR